MMYCERTTRYMWSGDMWEGGEGDNCFPRPCTAQHSLPWPGVGRTFGQDAVDAGCAVKISAIVTTFHHLQACSNTKERNIFVPLPKDSKYGRWRLMGRRHIMMINLDI